MSKVITDYSDVISKYDPSSNITRNQITRYEKTKILGLRMEQLARGAKPFISFPVQPVTDNTMLRDIANKELEERVLPFMIMRQLPNGEKEYWRLQDMYIA